MLVGWIHAGAAFFDLGTEWIYSDAASSFGPPPPAGHTAVRAGLRPPDTPPSGAAQGVPTPARNADVWPCGEGLLRPPVTATSGRAARVRAPRPAWAAALRLWPCGARVLPGVGCRPAPPALVGEAAAGGARSRRPRWWARPRGASVCFSYIFHVPSFVGSLSCNFCWFVSAITADG